jgi:Fe-S-cluster containining protein
MSQAPSFVDAGPFGAWLRQFRSSLRGDSGTHVPCGDCVACCVSSYSILVRPTDTRALSVIPAELLTPVPQVGSGVKALGYLSDGTCPMLRAGRCSIYGDRPQTCRDYDCRVFAAAGIEAGERKPVINRRVREWRFRFESAAEHEIQRAIQRTAAFLREHGSRFPEHRLPCNPSGIAVVAVKSYEVFLDERHESRTPDELAAAIAAAARAFDELSPPQPT